MNVDSIMAKYPNMTRDQAQVELERTMAIEKRAKRPRREWERRLVQDERNGQWYNGWFDKATDEQSTSGPRESRHVFTIFCKLPSDGRGEYSEEIDVRCSRRSAANAKQIAADVIASGEYVAELRPVRAVWRPIGWF